MSTNLFETKTDYSIGNLSKMYQQNRLDLAPPIQRKYVWNKNKKSFLIDTILRGYPLPKIFFLERSPNIEIGEEESKYEVIDGQQRLRTIMDFIRGVFPYEERYIPASQDRDDLVEKLNGKFYKDLNLEDKERFMSYKLTIDVINSKSELYDEDVDSNMFGRLNINNESVNKQELRNSNYKDTPLLKSILKEKDKNENKAMQIKGLSKSDKLRHVDTQYMSLLLSRILDNKPDISKHSLDKLYENHSVSFKKKGADVEKQIEDVIKKYYKVIEIIDDVFSFKKFIRPNRFFNKLDFSSLFGSMYQLHEEGYLLNKLNENKKIELQNKLLEFSKDVTHSMNFNPEGKSEYVKNYRTGMNARENSLAYKKREDAVYNFLIATGFFNKKDEKRFFDTTEKLVLLDIAKHYCINCKCEVNMNNSHADHIIPHSKGGLTTLDNGQILCKECNLNKGSIIL